MLQRKPRAKGSFDAGRSSIARWRTSVSTINLRLLRWHGQSTQRLRPGIGCRYLEFRLSITFAWFRYSRRFFSSATTVSMVTPGTPFSKSRRLQALPSLRHSSFAFFCRISSDIGVVYLVVQRVRPHHLFNQIAVTRPEGPPDLVRANNQAAKIGERSSVVGSHRCYRCRS